MTENSLQQRAPCDYFQHHSVSTNNSSPPLSLSSPSPQATNHNFAGKKSFILLLIMNPRVEISSITHLTSIRLGFLNVL